MPKLFTALAGNPNAGKSTLFNVLTGSNQHVGNWPGKTVAKQEGVFWVDDCEITVVDLPGAYSLAAYSPEEVVTRDFLLQQRPDLVVNVVDAVNLERNLYLTVQLLEMGLPLLVVLTMVDAATQRGITIDQARLSQALQTPVIAAVASQGVGIAQVKAQIAVLARQGLHMSTHSQEGQHSQQRNPSVLVVDYGQRVEHEIQTLETTIRQQPTFVAHGAARWLAIKLLEQDSDLRTRLLDVEDGPALLAQAQRSYEQLQQRYGEEVDVLIADRRYTWIHHLIGQVVRRPQIEITLTDKVDRIVTHRLLGVPIFLAVMWVVFKVTADVSAPFLDWIDGVISGPITRWVTALIGAVGVHGTWLEGLVVDGVIAGVGGVLVFVPVLMSLYISLAILEESGYLARAAFVMDHLMARIGLQGKSFLPMLVGFGCTVPAIYATRTLENEKDRILTGLLTPFMSCGARLPVYVLFATVFFPEYAGVVIFSLYLFGIVVAMLLGLLLRNTLFKNKDHTALLMELPPYHCPHWRTVWSHTWERTASFLQNAWSLILVTSLVLWLLMAIPTGPRAWASAIPLGQDGRSAFAHAAVDQSLFATVASALSPILTPLGFGSWEASGALISGFVAKEVVVSTIAQSYGLATDAAPSVPTTFGADAREIVSTFGQALVDTAKALPLLVGVDLRQSVVDNTVASDLRQSIYAGFEASSGGHAALAGLAFMVFVLIYTPCMVAVAAEKQELGVKWMWYSVISQLVLAWLLALVVFQGGLLLGLG